MNDTAKELYTRLPSKTFDIRVFLFLVLVILLEPAVAGQLARDPVRRLDYDSSAAQKIISTKSLPPPPIVVMPLSRVDPSRRTTAELWSSPICLQWDDGCHACMKTNPKDQKSVCKSINGSSCKPHNVWCTKSVDNALLFSLCRQINVEDRTFFSDGSMDAHDGSSLAEWIFSDKRWNLEVKDGYDLPIYRKTKATVSSHKEDVSCIKDYARGAPEEGRGLYIDLNK